MRRHTRKPSGSGLPLASRRLMIVIGPFTLLALLGSVVHTAAFLRDDAATMSSFEAVPTLWWASGTDPHGEHGDGVADLGSDTARRVLWRPDVEIPRGVPVDRVVAGDRTACAIAGGRIYCWGDNSHGQLGNGTTEASAVPVAVATAPLHGSALPADAVVTDVSVGSGAVCAVADGNVYCWGDNSAGRLGDDSLLATSVPVAVATDGVGGSSLPSGTATVVSTGGGGAGSTTAFTCAVADGKAHCWGSMQNGRLGHGVSGDIPSPVPIAVAETWGSGAVVTDVSIGRHSACAVADGRAYCWGNSFRGVLGNAEDDVFTDQTIPLAVETSPSSALPADPLVTHVDVGASSACAVHDGSPYCWGTNIAGQLGADVASDTEPDTTVVHRATPVARAGTGASDLPLDAAVVDLVAGGRLGGASTWCITARQPGGLLQAYCWGDGSAGQLGRGGTDSASVPLAVATLPASQLPDGVDLVALAAGEGVTILVGAP